MELLCPAGNLPALKAAILSINTAVSCTSQLTPLRTRMVTHVGNEPLIWRRNWVLMR